MRIFVINLARRPDRLAEITLDLHNHGLSFERVEAIDARTNPIVKHFRRPLLAAIIGKRAYSDAYIANYLSHRQIWLKMVEENIASVLVLEDDARITNFDKRFLDANIAELGLDVLRLGANQEPGQEPGQEPSQLHNNTLPQNILGRSLVKGLLWGSVATIFTLTAARKFLKHQKYWFPSDHYENFENCFAIKYAIVSPLLWRDAKSPSDVATAKNKLTIPQNHILKLTKPLRRHILLPAIQLYLRLVTALR